MLAGDAMPGLIASLASFPIGRSSRDPEPNAASSITPIL